MGIWAEIQRFYGEARDSKILWGPLPETLHWEWFFQGLLPMTWIPLQQQRLKTPLEQARKIETTIGYPTNNRVAATGMGQDLYQVQNQIASLT